MLITVIYMIQNNKSHGVWQNVELQDWETPCAPDSYNPLSGWENKSLENKNKQRIT